MTTNKFTLKLTAVRNIAPHVKHFEFSLPDLGKLQFTAGQFISLHIDTPYKEVRRNYSIANSPTKQRVIEIACTYLKGGIASELLFNLKIGDTLTASGPYGIFVLRPNDPQRYVLVATGTGVTPYRSMLPLIKQKFTNNSNIKFVLIFGTRRLEEVLYRDEFIEFAKQNDNFEYIVCLSRELPEHAQPFEHLGYVQDQFAKLAINLQEDIFYLCGNPNMVDDAFHKLLELGLDRKRIQREKYVSAR